MELRKVDPRVLLEDPNNTRRTQVHPAYDDQLLASIIATSGPVQPPVIKERNGILYISAGHRRVKACIRAEMPEIYVLVVQSDEKADIMASLAENLVRQGLNTVDTWRAMEALIGAGWTEDAVATALNLPGRTVKRLRLCGSIHNAVLEQMAKGDEPNERELRIIASAPREDQAEAWKSFKPKKNEPVAWHSYARSLDKRRMYARDANFDDATAKAHGVVWSEDLFEQGDQDSRYTTQVDDYLGAQHEWMEHHLPKKGVILTVGTDGQPKLPPKAVRNHGNPKKADIIGHYVDDRTGKITTIAYSMPADKPAASGKGKGKAGNAPAPEEIAPAPKTRPPVTQDGLKMIGDLQTDALHKAFAEDEIDDLTLIGLLVLAFAGKNVDVRTGIANEELRGHHGREILAGRITENGILTADPDTLRKAARDALQIALGLRTTNYGGNSGLVARIAGAAVNADRHLGGMATEEFLSCLSKAEIEAVASANGILPKPTGKLTRAAVIAQFKDGDYVYPGATFGLAADEIGAHAAAGNPRKHNFSDVEPEDGEQLNDPDAADLEDAA
ncbi:peptide transporter [Acidocella aquatica]|uniref:Peptide transporter n=1 Tax=Acidocella aquatica TaxID=1922313 RepID=A0ABQ6A4Y7_9PROT|nr:ParB N-terminal domain-containing protein [Acidocella aquatica]GLR66911.1 peptide transporter [Acidocella aquatica]